MNCGEVTPRRRHSGDESRIPVPSSPVLRRSGSQRLNSFSPIAEHTRNGKITSNQSPLLNRHRSLSLNAPLSSCLSPDRDDDLDSVQSFGSNASVTSTMSQCDHASFARNGTTFSSRQKRFVVHCSPQMSPGEEYLTPTQRANRTIRRLKNLLADVQAEVIEKDQEIFRLTKEVVELRLLKAGGPAFNVNEKEEVHGGNSSVRFLPSLSTNNYKQETTTTVENNNTEAGASCMLSCDVTSTSEDRQISSSSSSSSPTTQSSALICGAKDVHDHSELPFNGEGISPPPVPLGEVPPSLVDSGHFEDLNNTKDWAMNSPHNSPSVSQPQLSSTPNTSHSHPSLSPQSNPAIENLRRQHEDEIRDIREKHNDKVDSLLQRITEANDRYYELRPKLEAEEIKIRELEQEIGKLKTSQEELRPKLETAEIRVRDLERENENLKINEQELRPRLETAESKIQDLEQENDNLKKTHEEAEEKHKAVYLEMYKKGQVAAQYETEVMQANKESEQKKESGANEELLVQLDVTKKELENIRGMYNRLVEQRKSISEHDPEMTLQFLKSAIYYFLTDRENTHGHLAAIESILGFTDNEKLNIDKASYYWR